MRPLRSALFFILFFVGGFFLFLHSAQPVQAATFTVNSTADDNDGTCVHPFVSAASDCTWREAINAANGSAGTDTVTFAIDGSFADDGDGQWVISIVAATSAFTGPTTITAVSVWDVDDDRPGIKLLRTTATSSVIDFTAAAVGGSKVQGLEVQGGATGISTSVAGVTIGTDCDGVDDDIERNVIRGTGTQGVFLGSSGAKVKGNYIGVLADGVTASTFGAQGIRVIGVGGDNNIIGYEEGTSGSCSASVQRNVIGGGDSSTDNGILIASTATVDLEGDAAVAPNNNIVAGNYIGIGADGVTDIGVSGNGVEITNAATLNTIGSDLDGIDDDLEANVISGWGSSGVFFLDTGFNTVAGNQIGLKADGVTAQGNGNHGVLLRGQNSTAEGNVVGFNTGNGIRLGAGCVDCLVIANTVGTDEARVIDAGNTDEGIFVHRGNDGVTIGGAAPADGNVVYYNNDGGILIDGYFSGTPFVSGPTDGYAIQNNLVALNDSFGIKLLGTEQDGVVGVSDGDVADNEVADNAASGIVAEGSSPTISENEIHDNGLYGIEIRSSYRHDEPSDTGLTYSNPYDTLSPDEAAGDSVGAPLVEGNDIFDNSEGGIFIIDANADNIETLAGDNTIALNGDFDVRRDWYAAIEILDLDGDTLTTGLLDLRLIPADDLACTDTCEGDTFADAGGGDGVWGPSGIDYNDATSWFQVTDFIIDAEGAESNYNPYTVVFAASGNQRADIAVTFNGDGSDEIDGGHLPVGIDTSGVTRYQTPDISGRRAAPPATAGIEAPTPLTPVALSSSAIRWYFSDNASNETGFRLVTLEGNVETVVADGDGPDLTFLDETNLAASTEYCDRYVYAFNNDGTSDYVLLPCATTLSTGEVAEETEIPIVSVDQKVYLQNRVGFGFITHSMNSLAPSLALLGAFLSLGWLHVMRLKRRNCSGQVCWNTYAGYLGLGLIASVGAFVWLEFSLARPVKADVSFGTPVTSTTLLRQGDRLQFVFTVANSGGASAEDLVFSDQLPAGLNLDGIDGQMFTASVGDIAPSGTVQIIFTALVEIENGNLSNVGVVAGSNILTVSSNAILLRVQTTDAPIISQVGALIKVASKNTVYYLDDDGTRRPFLDEQTYFSWYPDFSGVRTITDDAMAVIPVGKALLPRPGTWLVKVPYDPTVYATTPGSDVLRAIPNETRARQIYGADWNQQIMDIEDYLLILYQPGAELGAFELPDGLLLTDGTKICYVHLNGCREVTPDGMAANRFLERFVRQPNISVFQSLHPTDDPITGLEDHLVNPD